LGTNRRLNRRQKLAAALWNLAIFEQADSTRPSFRAKAYREAVWSLDRLSAELSESEAELRSVPRIGAGVAALITEFREGGEIERLRILRERLPEEAGQLGRLPRMTPRRFHWLKTELGVESREDLTTAIDIGAVAALPGVGPLTVSLWKDRLRERAHPGIPTFRAARYGTRLADHLEQHVDDLSVIMTGSVRRLEEWVEAIDLVAIRGRGLRRFLRQSALVQSYRAVDDRIELDTLDGPVAVHQTPRSRAGSVILATTGPANHVVAVRDVAGEVSAPTEEEIYRRAGSQFIPAPARAGDFPAGADVVTVADIRGDFHLHTDWSPDGRQDLETLVARARKGGYEYIAVTDHGSKLLFGGLTPEDLLRQRELIEKVTEANPGFLILQGAELNIGRDGSVDYDDEVLAALDFRLAGVHSFFDLGQAEQTDRLLQTVTNPLIHAISHLTGRRIGTRPPIKIDLQAVIEAAAEHRTVLEVNGHLDRMDMSADHTRLATARKVILMANSDAHRPDEIPNIGNAVGILQKARVRPSHVLNTWPAKDVTAWLRRPSLTV
jgi:DNA polymerase (family X)